VSAEERRRLRLESLADPLAEPVDAAERSAVDDARPVFDAAIAALTALRDDLGAPFVEAVDLLHGASGRVIVTGMGKSGLVGAKAAATFRSTGTPAFFLHPAEALHGDLGLVTPGDVVLALSKSGRTQELAAILPLFERLGAPIAAIVGDPDSPLARAARVVLRIPPVVEAGPSGVVPTTSSTAALVLCDALAVALMERRGFDAESLAFVHAGGLVGRQAALTVADLMHTGEDLPRVGSDVTLREALVEIIRKKLGMTTIVNPDGGLAGVLTDGDLKRILVSDRGTAALDEPVARFMSISPRTIDAQASIALAVRTMEDPARGPVTCLVAVTPSGVPAGVLHLHDCLKSS